MLQTDTVKLFVMTKPPIHIKMRTLYSVATKPVIYATHAKIHAIP